MCCIYLYTGMRTRPSTPMIPLEAIPQREKDEGSACVYLSALSFPSTPVHPECSGCHAVPVSHDSLFLLTSSVNIPWSKGGKGDSDYHYAFQKVVMPIAKEFAPEIVLGM
jgi:histone deacetylase 6